MGSILKRLYLNYILLPERYVVRWKTYLAENDITTMALITKLIQDFIDGLDS